MCMTDLDRTEAPTRATFREVLALREFQALYGARLLSLIGDQMTRIALAVAVYAQSKSPLLSAATFASSFLPYLVAGPVLATLGDRFPRRHVMVVCDLLRAALLVGLAMPGVPVPLLFGLLLVSVVLAAPFESARAALMPEVLPGDAYVVGTALNQTANQLTQVIGLVIGGVAVATLHPSGALLLDAGTFVASALLLAGFVRKGSVAEPRDPAEPRSLFSDVRAGALEVWRRPVLRAVVLLAWTISAFSVVPEGLAVVYAAQIHHGDLATGLLIAALPTGALVGNLVVGRLVAPNRRGAWMRPLGLLAVLPLILTFAVPPLPITLLIWSAAGFGAALHLPAITTFVAHTPTAMRSRAFGLADSGLQAVQGLGLVAGGALAQWLAPSTVVGLAGVAGALSVGLLLVAWPTELRSRFIVLPETPPTVATQTGPRHRRTARATSS
jgi:MFS family permease